MRSVDQAGRASIVAIEGIDGAGKATQADLLHDAITAAGGTAQVVSFPVYESFFGSTIRQLLDGKLPHSADTVDPRSMALWYALDRWEEFQGLDVTGGWLILNRFTLSNAVYQSARLEAGGPDGHPAADPGEAERVFHWVLDLEQQHLQLPVPAVTVVLDVEPEVSQVRSDRRAQEAGAGASQDVYERSSTLLKAARRRYLQAAEDLSGVVVVACLDATGAQRPAGDVHRDVVAAVCPELLGADE
jgi:dTMP kinase